jgi:hypothetical protein
MALKHTARKNRSPVHSEKLSNPLPLPPGSAFDPVQEQRQLLRAQTLALTLVRGLIESPLFQAFCANEQPGAVPKQNLKPIARLIGKDKPMPAGRLLFQHGLYPGIEAVETLAHIHRFQGHKDPGGAGEAQHGRCKAWSTEPIHPGVAAALKRIVNSLDKVTSAAQAPTPGNMAATLTSWNSGTEAEPSGAIDGRLRPF